MVSPQNGSPAPAVTRAFAILQLIARAEGPVGPTALARELDLAKSSTLNVCRALEEAGAIGRVPGGYELGRTLAELGGAYLNSFDEVRAFHRAFSDLPGGHPDTVQLATLTDGLEVIYLARREGSTPVRLASEIGKRLPANCTAVGKAMLARQSGDELDALLASVRELPRPTERSIGDTATLRQELAVIRSRGYALDWGEMVEGVVCVGAAVPTTAYETRPMAVSSTMMESLATDERIQDNVELLETLVKSLAGR